MDCAGFPGLGDAAMFRRLLEESRDTHLVVDAEAGCFAFASPAVEALTGFAPRDLVGRAPRDAEARRLFDLAADDTTAEAVLSGPDGHAVTVEFDRHPFTQDGRRLVHVTLRDVTRRDAAESDLKATLDRLAEAQAIAMVGNWEWTVDDDRVHWSDELFRIFGHEPGSFEPSRDSFLAAVHPDDRGAVKAQLAAIPRDGNPVEASLRIVRPDGSVRHLRTRRVAHVGPDGRVARMAGTVQDITHLRDIESRLGVSERKYRGVVENAGDAIFIHDLDGRIVDVNRRACEVLGFERDELRAMSIQDVVRGVDPVAAKALWARVARGETTTVMSNNVTRDGAEIPVEVRLGCFEENGRPMIVAIVRDVSERRAAENAMHRAMTETRDAARAKTEFLHNMGHEMRTPLNAIIGFSEVLRSDLFQQECSSRARVYLGDIGDSARHLLDLINDLLDASMIETSDIRLHHEVLQVADLITSAARLVGAKAEAKGVTVEITDVAGVRIEGDIRRLKQVLINLLSNAVKFSEAGQRVTVEAWRTESGGVAVSVSDHGIGMAEDEVARVLAPFAQGQTGLERRYEGLGLGLFLARRFVEAHGGEIAIASRPGVGTTATVTLPPERVVA